MAWTPQNGLFLGAALLASALTQSLLPLIFGVGAWAVGAVGLSLSGRQRRYFEWLQRTEAKRGAVARRHQHLVLLGEDARQRYLEIERVREDVQRLSTQNPGLAVSLMDRELREFDALVDLFLKLLADEARYRAYAEASDLAEIDRAIAVQTEIVEGRTKQGDARPGVGAELGVESNSPENLLDLGDKEAKQVAEDHLATLRARRERAVILREKLRTTRAQINLLDETLRYLRDQVVTMGSEEELTGRLGALKSSLHAIEQSALETERALLGSSPEATAATARTRASQASLATAPLKNR